MAKQDKDSQKFTSKQEIDLIISEALLSLSDYKNTDQIKEVLEKAKAYLEENLKTGYIIDKEIIRVVTNNSIIGNPPVDAATAQVIVEAVQKSINKALPAQTAEEQVENNLKKQR